MLLPVICMMLEPVREITPALLQEAPLMVARGIEFAGEETWYGGETLSPGICMVLELVRETIPALQREVPPTVARDIEFVREET